MTRSLLGRAFEEAAGPARVICPKCLGPNPPNVLRSLVLFDDEPVPLCEECGEPVDHFGRALAVLRPDGQYVAQVLRVHGNKQEP